VAGSSRARVYSYLVATLTVSLDKAFPSVIQALRDAGLDVLDYDEASRRVVVRASAGLAPVLASMLRAYASSYTLEAKGSARLRVDPRLLRSAGYPYTRFSGRLLFLADCGGAMVWGEERRGRLLLKYCRRGLYRDPASFPQGLCSFPGGDPVELVEAARRCFIDVVSRLRGEGRVDVKGEASGAGGGLEG